MLKERKDTLISKLFKKKIELLFDDEANLLQLCVYCHQLFPEVHKGWMHCPAAKVTIDYHGVAISHHLAEKAWNLNDFVMFTRQKGVTWKELYWKIWAYIEKFQCSGCGTSFIAARLNHCLFHPEKL